MALWKTQSFKDFCYAQTIPILIHLLIIAFFTRLEYDMRYFCYVIPVIFFIMYLSYQCFWKPNMKCNCVFKVLCPLMLSVFSGTFFGIQLGIFGQITSLPLYEVHNCYVSGQLVVNILGIEKYSILYVNYEKDGENYLGYGCTSGQTQTPAGIYSLSPFTFYSYGQEYSCGDVSPDDSYYDTRLRTLEQNDKQNRITKYDNMYNKRYSTSDGCLEKWSFSEVKIPSWMCLPNYYAYEDLITPKKCYIAYYGDKEASTTNSLNRNNLKYTSNFVIAGFSDFLVPLDQYMVFLIFCYCPFIVTLNLISVPFTRRMTTFINKAHDKYQKLNYAPYIERNSIKQTDVQQGISSQCSPYLAHDQNSPLIHQSDFKLEHLNLHEHHEHQLEIDIPKIISHPIAENDNEIHLQTIQIHNKQQHQDDQQDIHIVEEDPRPIEFSLPLSEKSFKDSPNNLKSSN